MKVLLIFALCISAAFAQCAGAENYSPCETLSGNNGYCVREVCTEDCGDCFDTECSSATCEFDGSVATCTYAPFPDGTNCGGSTGGYVCHSGTCGPDPCAGVECRAENPCWTSDCVDGACQESMAPSGSACNTATGATGTCDAGTCVEESSDPCAGVECVPTNACRTSECVEGACQENALPDGNACSSAPGVYGTCHSGDCVTDAPCSVENCYSENFCVTASCNGNECVESFNDGVTCSYEDSGSVHNGRCDSGYCVPDAPPPCDSTTVCEPEPCWENAVCDPDVGTCTKGEPVADGRECALSGTTSGQCVDGKCVEVSSGDGTTGDDGTSTTGDEGTTGDDRTTGDDATTGDDGTGASGEGTGSETTDAGTTGEATGSDGTTGSSTGRPCPASFTATTADGVISVDCVDREENAYCSVECEGQVDRFQCVDGEWTFSGDLETALCIRANAGSLEDVNVGGASAVEVSFVVAVMAGAVALA